MELGIAQAGLSESDSRRLKTMLIMALRNSGLLRETWIFTNVAAANLVVTNLDSEEGRALINGGEGMKGQLYAALAGEADEIPAEFLRLSWPIRLENLIKLLQAVEEKAEQLGPQSDKPPATAPIEDSGLLRFASFLRESDNAETNTAWKIEGVGRRSVYVSPADKVFYFGESLNRLRGIDPDIQLNFVPVPIESVGGKAGKKPLTMLQWLIGLQTGASGLLPWIDNDLAMMLRRYPAFHILHHTPEHRRIAAVMSRPRKNVEIIASTAGVDALLVYSFVNATNLCGYLSQKEVKSLKGTSALGLTKRPRALFKSFRKALGIESNNV